MAVTSLSNVIPASVLVGIESKKPFNFQNFWNLVANIKPTSNPEKVVQIYTDLGDASYHTDLSTQKTSGTDAVEGIEVSMKTLYKLFEVEDYEFEGAGADLKNAIKEQLPKVLVNAAIRSMFGTTEKADSPFTGFTTTALEVDNTAASWAAALEAVENAGNGHTPTAWLLSTKAKALVRAAYASGANTNVLRDTLVDGMDLAGVPAYFGTFTNPAIAGAIADWDKVLIVIYKDIAVKTFLSDDSIAGWKSDVSSVGAKLRIGIKVTDQTAVQPLVFA